MNPLHFETYFILIFSEELNPFHVSLGYVYFLTLVLPEVCDFVCPGLSIHAHHSEELQEVSYVCPSAHPTKETFISCLLCAGYEIVRL